MGFDIMPHSPSDRLQDEQFRASELVQGSVLSAHHGKGLQGLILKIKRSTGCSQGDGGWGWSGSGKSGKQGGTTYIDCLYTCNVSVCGWYSLLVASKLTVEY